MDAIAMLIVSNLVHPLVILAGVVPYFGIRNAPWTSLAAAAAAGAFVGVIRNAGLLFTPIDLALSVGACVVGACAWWALLHWTRPYWDATARAKKERPRPRLVRDEDDWRK